VVDLDVPLDQRPVERGGDFVGENSLAGAGSPFTSNGRCSVTAAFTATSRSRVAMYFSVLLNPATSGSFNKLSTVSWDWAYAAIPATGGNGERPRIMSDAFSAIIIVEL